MASLSLSGTASEPIDYSKTGVDRQAADQFVERISALASLTSNRRVKASVGGYASLFALDSKRWLAASTDGVGTKLKLAFRLGAHRTVGIDLVAMSVNDLLCVGAEPLFFLDYFATGKLDLGVGEDVLAGIVEGCRQAGCALVGGETAEMPDFYSKGEYDLAGFAVGFVDPARALPRKDIQAGDVLIGIASSGVHSNGFSLIRKRLPTGRAGDELARTLLAPTRIYAASLKGLIASKRLKGLAHITGSGFLNVPRMSEAVDYEIDLPARAERPPVYDWIWKAFGLGLEEMAQTFNLGVGMVAVVAPSDARAVLAHLKKKGEKAWTIGHAVARPKVRSQAHRRSAKRPCEIRLRENGLSVTLSY